MAGKIFINYRRDDSRDAAARIRDRLANVFGTSNVFMDVDNLLVGQRFDKELEKALAQCDVFLAIIGQRWMQSLTEREKLGERDYVREEIAAALARGTVVIPVLIEHTPLPRRQDLPEEIQALVLHQKHDIVHDSFGRDITSLVEGIKAGSKSLRRRTPLSREKILARSLAAVVVVAALLFGAKATWDFQEARRVEAEAASNTKKEQERLAKLAEEDAKTKAEEKRNAEETAAQKRSEEAAAQKKAEEEQRTQEEGKRQAALAAIVRQELEKKAAEKAEARKRKEEEAARKAQQAEAAKKAVEDEERRKFDGYWTITTTYNKGCVGSKSQDLPVVIRNRTFVLQDIEKMYRLASRESSISESGVLQMTEHQLNGRTVYYQGNMTPTSGKGTWRSEDNYSGGCTGGFSMKRDTG